MANVNIKFNGKEFLLSCEDGQEEHLEELSLYLNEKFENLRKSLGNIGENKLLLITSITVLDEFFETKKNIDLKKNEIGELKNKFKELKSLVYEYKDKKEDEIKLLKDNLEQLKNQIEQDNKNYDKILNNVTNHIEDFLKKANENKSMI
ncbi:cell division protein ZapA [Candidatus Pelagibacter sp.]|nr:cell division protein ZapA [Candidatus Pelagibacter sp.]